MTESQSYVKFMKRSTPDDDWKILDSPTPIGYKVGPLQSKAPAAFEIPYDLFAKRLVFSRPFFPHTFLGHCGSTQDYIGDFSLGKCYSIVQLEQNRFCPSEGDLLASIHSAQENAFIRGEFCNTCFITCQERRRLQTLSVHALATCHIIPMAHTISSTQISLWTGLETIGELTSTKKAVKNFQDSNE